MSGGVRDLAGVLAEHRVNYHQRNVGGETSSTLRYTSCEGCDWLGGWHDEAGWEAHVAEHLERVVAEARAEERSSMQVAGYAAGTMRAVEVGQAQRALDAAREAGRAEVVAKVEAVHCQIGPYRAAQTAIGDLDREHIDVLAVGTILSDLRRELVAKYNAAIRAAVGRQAGGGE